MLEAFLNTVYNCLCCCNSVIKRTQCLIKEDEKDGEMHFVEGGRKKFRYCFY